jgi:CheY-like chemotaxis protein
VERGARNVSLSTIDKLAQALQVSTATLLGQATADPSTHPVQVLLVEANQGEAASVVGVLRKAGVVSGVHVVRDGAEALEYLFGTGRYSERSAERGPVLVLLDLALHKMSGIEVIRRIKGHARTRDTHVIVLASAQLEGSVAEASRLGAAGHLAKPFAFKNFSDLIPKLQMGWALVQSPATTLPPGPAAGTQRD